MSRLAPFLIALISGMAIVSTAFAPSPHTLETEHWRAARLARLTAPEGWLSLTGLAWLNAGANRVGRGADNDIVLTTGPAHLGVLTLADDGTVHAAFAPQVGVTVDGQPATDVELRDDLHGAPSDVRFGTTRFFVIDRGGRKALRVKDPNAEARVHFLGIDYFSIDPAWRVEADWVPFTPPHDLEMGTAIGTIDRVKVPGKAVFTRGGRSFELLPYQEEPGGELFFVLADRTSGKETYGAARFLYAALPDHGLDHPGKLVLDFNRAYNPPCAFTAFATCPLAPPENRLDLAVTAGEKKYRGGH